MPAKITKTPEELAEIRRLYEEGMTVLEISFEINCAQRTAGRLLREAGTNMRPPVQRTGTRQTRAERNDKRRVKRSKHYLEPGARIANSTQAKRFR